MIGRLRPFGALLFLCLPLSACHNGGSSATVLPQSASVKVATLLPQGVSSTKTGIATFSVVVPAGSTPAMQSLVVSLAQINGVAPTSSINPVTLNLNAKTPGCARQTDGSTRCTTSINVPAGTDTFTMITYALPNGTGALVSTTQTTTAITAGGKILCTQTSTGLTPAKVSK